MPGPNEMVWAWPIKWAIMPGPRSAFAQVNVLMKVPVQRWSPFALRGIVIFLSVTGSMTVSPCKGRSQLV